MNAIHWAVEGRLTEMVEKLTEGGYEIGLKERLGRTALDMAAEGQLWDMLECLNI